MAWSFHIIDAPTYSLVDFHTGAAVVNDQVTKRYITPLIEPTVRAAVKKGVSVSGVTGVGSALLVVLFLQ